jgi:hypothetical protein
MKIGILTFFRSNYGAILQAYALQQTLVELGHSAVLIDYPGQAEKTKDLFLPWLSLKGFILNFFTVLRYQQLLKRRENIQAFRRRFLHVSAKRYHSGMDLENGWADFDAFVTGSDQVWHPRSDNDLNRSYFLGFVNQNQAIKISYAPSFGVSSVSESFRREIGNWVNDIPHLSVREETGRAIIEQMSGRSASVVLDPTLLLDRGQWNPVIVPPVMSDPYVLVYSTSQRGLFSDLVKHIKNRVRLPVVVLSLHSLNMIPMADRVIYDAGPGEFVGLFKRAACVCTNSFHGTAFSIIYRKPFWSVPHNTTNSRISDLLSRIALSDRQVNAPSEFPESPLEIDYEKPESLLDDQRLHSIDFLQSALNR